MNRKTPVAATGKCCRQVAVTVKITGNRRFTAGKVNSARDQHVACNELSESLTSSAGEKTVGLEMTRQLLAWAAAAEGPCLDAR